jgi:tRNA (guanosine-2'-O-)-methyltransferase
MKQLRGKPLKDYLKKVEQPGLDLVLVLQDVEDPVNVGAAFRIADACGARELALAGTTPSPPHPSIAGIGRGTHRRVNWSYRDSAAEAIQAFKESGYMSFALEVASGSVPYYDGEYRDKVCLVVGNEYYGVAKRTISACDRAVYVPMYGKVMSLNVHVALGIVAYHIVHNERLCPQ